MKNSDFFIENNKHFKDMLEILNCSLICDYSYNDIGKIRYLCKMISLYNGNVSYDKKIKLTNIFNLFLEIIKSLGNKELYEFYKEKVFEIPISFHQGMKKGNAFVEHFFIDNTVLINSIHMSSKIKSCTDVSSYVHEMGHVAYFENKPKERIDYFEYTEVLPILLEYFAFIFLLENKGEELFFRERLFMEKSAAIAGIKTISKLDREHVNDDKKLYYKYDIADSNKYLISSDFVFKSLDYLKEDRVEFLKLFSSTLMGENTICEFGSKLGIKNDGCKRLIKEYERRM